MDILHEQDRNLILQIHLSHTDMEDTLYWRFEHEGEYTVKSAYNLLLFLYPLSSLNPIHPSPMWKQLWSLKIPPKIKNLIWRMCHNCLLMKDLLKKKHVDVDPSCGNKSTRLHTLPFCCYMLGCSQTPPSALLIILYC